MDLISDRLPSAPGPGGDADPSAPMLPTEAHTNPFETDIAATAIKMSAPALFEAAPGSENAFVQPSYNNGHANGNPFEFLDHAADVVNAAATNVAATNVAATTNGKIEHHDDDEDDSEVEAEITAAARAARLLDGASFLPTPQPIVPEDHNSNPFCDDLERQQTKEFDPEGEPARDTPTPPADEVPGVIGLVSDNVAESGEESEDEWNYYRVEPTGKSPQPTSEAEQQTKEEVCQKDQLENKEETSEDNMESQLNPNAAEFIPSPTHTMPSMEEVLLAKAKQEASIDDIVVPSSSEFEKEVSTRPGDVSFENSFFNSSLSSVNTTGLLEEQEKEFEKQSEFSQSLQENFVNPLSSEPELSQVQDDGVVLDESAAFSTKAEFGDESTTSFMTTESDFQKISSLVGPTESSVILEDSIHVSTAPAQDFVSEEPGSEPEILENNVETAEVQENEITFQDNFNDFQKEPVHISFELQKEIAPQMESQPERVKVDSVDDSPVEPDIQIVNDISGDAKTLSELQFSDNMEYGSSDNVPQNKEVVEDFMLESIPQELSEDVQMADVNNYEKTEEVVSRVGFEFLNDFSKSDLVPPIVDSVEESPIVSIENFRTDVGSSIDDFRENLTIHNESLNMLNNEISTPEYEQLEKVVEASEALMDQINMTKKEMNIRSSEERILESDLVEDVILESAHPDKTELLVDACAEFTPGSVDSFSNLDKFSYINDAQNLSEQCFAEQSPETDLLHSDSDKSVLPSGGAPIIETEQSLQLEDPIQMTFESEFSAPVVNSNDLAPVETAQVGTLLETTQTPPPTPAVNHLEQPDLLQSLQETSDLAQAIEKLSVAEHTLTESVSDEVQKSITEVSSNTISAVETLVQSEVSPVINGDEGISATEVMESTEQKLEEENVSDPVAVAIAGVAVASMATAAAVASVKEQDSKKESEQVPKKTAASSITKKSTADKPKSSAERPKVGIADKSKVAASTTRTTPSPASKLTSTTKAKSPTSPVKPTVAAKTTRPPATMPSKPLPKTSTTKPASRPLSSVTGTASTATRTKPAVTATSLLSKPSTNKTTVLKSRPSPTLNAEKKPLTNGDIKTAPKRPEQLVSKTTSRPTTRPSTAPVSKSTTATKPLTKVSSTVSKTTSSTLNGPSKTRPSSSLASRTTSKVSTDKEIKESANKQISTRTSSTTTASSTVRSSTLSSPKSSVTAATRKIESKPLTNGKTAPGKTSSLVKSSTMTKVPPKRPATATRLKSTKTSTLVEKSETVQGSKTVVTTNEVKSEIVIDNNQSAA